MPVFPNMKCCRVESYDGREGTSEFPSLRDSECEIRRFAVEFGNLDISLLKTMQSRSPTQRSSGRNRRLWDNPLPEAKNPG